MIKKLFGHSIIYGLTGVTSNFAAIFLVPIYTRVLTPEDYGVIAILRTVMGISIVVFNLGMGSAIFWAYFKAESDEEKKEVAGTALIFQTLYPLLLTTILIIISPFFNGLIFEPRQPFIFFTVVFFTVFFQAGIAIPLAILRANQQPTRYVLVTLCNLILTIFLSVVLVVFLKWGVLGVILASLISSSVVYFVSLLFTLKNIIWRFSAHWFKEMLTFGLPMVPAGLSLWILNSSDRYFLNYFGDIADVGIYNVGYRLGSIIILFVGAIQLAYAPFVFSVFKRSDAKDIYRRFASYYLLILFFVGLLVAIFSREAVLLLTGPKFHEAYKVVPFITFSYVAWGMYYIFSTGVSVMKKTIFSTAATFLAGGLNLLLNWYLIARFGMMGAALATLFSFVALMVFMYNFSNRFYTINYDFRRFFKIIVVGCLILLAGLTISLPIYLSIPIKMIMSLSYFLFLFLLGFFTKEEIGKMSLFTKKIWSAKDNPRDFFNSLARD